jgi:hypothetical protein
MTALTYNNSHAIITISWQLNKLALGQTYALKEYKMNVKIQRRKLNTFLAYKLHNPTLFLKKMLCISATSTTQSEVKLHDLLTRLLDTCHVHAIDNKLQIILMVKFIN